MNIGFFKDRKEALDLVSNLKVEDRFVDGKCTGCGECCSNILPMTAKEIERIGKYIRYMHIEPVNHTPAIVVGKTIDMVCPFLDTSKPNKKCKIYSVRPEICREFECHKAATSHDSDIPLERLRQMLPVHVRETFYGEEE